VAPQRSCCVYNSYRRAFALMLRISSSSKPSYCQCMRRSLSDHAGRAGGKGAYRSEVIELYYDVPQLAIRHFLLQPGMRGRHETLLEPFMRTSISTYL
jgi:hypothetical protein